MYKLTLTAGLCLTIASLASSSSLVCYYDGSAEDRAGDGGLPFSQMNPDHCTHLVYAFSDINNQNELIPSTAADIQHFRSLSGLKTKKPQLKTLLAVGGLTFDTNKFSAMVSAKQKRARFIQSAIKLLRTHEFDGINLDWRYPGGAGSRPQDKQKFTLLCKELKDAFVAEGKATNRESLIAIASVSAEKTTIDASYEVAKIAMHLDFIHVLTFDLDGSSENFEHDSPLYQGSQDVEDNICANTDSAMQYWCELGAPAQKLILGLVAYGQLFNLSSASKDVGAPLTSTTTAPSTTITTPPTNTTTAAPATTTAAPPTTTAAPPTPTTTTTTIATTIEASGKLCRGNSNGRFPNPDEPTTFYNCANGVAYIQSCQPGLIYKPSCDCCDWP